MSSIDSKLLIMGLSAGIAFVSLLLTLYSAHLTRKNNRLTVRPKLTFYENWFDSEGVLGIAVKNNGHGMALIKSMNLYNENTEIVIDNNKWIEFLKLNDINQSNILYQFFLSNDAMAAGESLNLIYHKDKGDSEGIRQLKQAVKNSLGIKITYTCLHNVEYSDTVGIGFDD